MIIPDSNSASGSYDIDNSLKLEHDNSERLLRNSPVGTTVSVTNATVSYWVKRTELGIGTMYTWKGVSTWQNAAITNPSGYSDVLYVAGGNETYYKLVTNRVFKDTSAWYHIFIAYDTTQSTASDRIKIYINGVQETSFAVENYPSQNRDLEFLAANGAWVFGWYETAASVAPCYLAEAYLFHDQTLAPTDFGEFDTDTGIWKPIEYTGSFSQYDWYYDFENSASLGADASGNGNNITYTYNITSADQATDTPTNNFCTLRPAYEPKASITLKEGATVWQNLGNSNSAFQPNTTAIGTFQLSAGKWYWECTWTNDGDRALIGIVASLADIRQTTDWQEYIWWDGYNGWIGSSLIATETNPPAFDSINTIGIALDCDNQRITFSKDGGWLEASGNMNGSSPSDWRWDWTSDSDFLGSVYSNGNVTPMVGVQSDANTVFPIANINFGGYAATIRTSGGNSDANGYGNFAYPVPSGFYALCTKNLAKYG